MSGSSLTQTWKWKRGTTNVSDGHNSRICDVNGDGVDDFCEIGFVINGANGTLLYSLTATGGVVHGDRWHIAKMDSSRSGLQGYGIQQNNASGLYDYYYDARNGTMIWKHMNGGATVDVGPVMRLGRSMVFGMRRAIPGFPRPALNPGRARASGGIPTT